MAEPTSASRTRTVMIPMGETFKEKAKRKLVEEPLVPLGCGLTVVALWMATRQYRRGNKQSMNHWLRFRVAAQGFTLLAICAYGFAVRRERTRAKEAGEETATFVQPALEKQKMKEQQEFRERLAAAEKAAEAEPEKVDLKSVDWKAAWKEGILKKNAENDERRQKPSDRV